MVLQCLSRINPFKLRGIWTILLDDSLVCLGLQDVQKQMPNFLRRLCQEISKKAQPAPCVIDG